MKPRYGVAVFGLCLAFAVALPVAAAEQLGPLEFYGYAYTKAATPQLAFLRQGARIFIAAEGDLIEDKYMVVLIGVDSAVVEDTSNKHRQTTLPLKDPRPSDGSAAAPVPSVARPGNPRNVSPATKARGPSK